MTTNAPLDPSNLLQKPVKIHSLTSKPELNSKIGTAQSYIPDRERYLISLPPHISPSPVALKPANLTEATIVERATGKIDEALAMAHAIYHDMQWRQILSTARTTLQSKLPPSIKPEHALVAFAAALLVFIITIGFMRFIMLASLLLLLAAVALPDILEGKQFKLILKNFPMRFREAIRDHAGYDISQKKATVFLIGFLLLTTKILLQKSGGSGSGGGRNAGAGAATGMDSDGKMDYGSFDAVKQSSPSWTMEEVYNMGYQDAINEKPIGDALPPNHATMVIRTISTSASTSTSTSSKYDYNDDDYDDYAPPPPKKSQIGFGTIMALFTIGRTVKELGFVGGRFDWDLFRANAINLPPLKKAFLGFMAYRLVSAFL
mmetsp:Transcript_12449/g.18115  ORF Transcript_12449/g.18115 Transcript_12449/m.18115 type:complete len:376 (-) Transcript_12449:445-1572(-)|eukprot:CAMPEP_0197246116 /NCGR_PEP_ID=MMETSP1429-20130617/10673_1 /TAXON_ID=49237 /ORGANISM="Chaetoceros  sp., Strain UNC1202" /LENGTH=375 /DNA_ID=CAMNT_0042706721 /DNA_START=29 /DNA_END=1156 /DNA_ORIENTATION=+